MIGTKIRGFRHLIHLAKASQEIQFLFKHDSFSIGGAVALYIDGSKCKDPFTGCNGDYLIVMNDCYSNIKCDGFKQMEGTDWGEKIKAYRGKWYQTWIVPVNKSNFRDENSLFSELVGVPADFEKQYENFCNANKKQMPNATKYTSIDSSLFKYIFAISSGSKNFFFWAVNAYFKNGASIYQLENILRWNDKYNQLQSKLMKGTITAYTSQNDFIGIVREMTLLRRNKRANDVISSFNTQQKKALKNYSLSDRDYDTLSKFGKLSSKKKLNFIRKMSTIEDPAEIIRQMSFLADIHFEWNKKSFMDYISNLEGLNCEVVLEKGDIVLLKVKDYEAVKRLAKATNWCISKDKKYWNEYVEANREATQYVIFDFSRREDDNLSIVGFTTVHDRGITHAHDFQNRNIMGSRRSTTVSEIKSFLAEHVDCSNIYGVLTRDGINLSDVLTYEPTHYEWNRKSMFNYLSKCVDSDDYYIVADNKGKVAFIVENDDVRYFLGDAYMDNRHRGYQSGDQYIIFADFNKKATDPDKLIFGVISHNFTTHESSCSKLYNERFETITKSFDSKLEEYGLPYDTICRTDNVVDRFYSAFAGYELSTVKELIKSKDVIDDIKTHNRASILRDALINVTLNFYSLDYLNVIYGSGLTLDDFLGEGNAFEFCRRVVNFICDIDVRPSVPSEENIALFNEGKLTNYDAALRTGMFKVLMSIIERETNTYILYGITAGMLERRRKADLFDLVMTTICNTKDMNDTDLFKVITNYAFKNNSLSVINALNKCKLSNKLSDYLKGFSQPKSKSTEMWVKRDNGTYVLEGANAEQIAHAPRRR